MVTDRADGRAQLVLVGSVAVAVTIIGLAAVLNAAMYTDALISSDGSRSEVRTAGEYRRIVETDLRRLVNETGGPDALRDNVTTYRERISIVAARSASASVDVRLVDTSPSGYTFAFTYLTPELRYETTITIGRPAP